MGYQVERKYADRPDWKRVLKRRFKLEYVKASDFEGYVSAIYIDKVTTPLIKEIEGKTVRLVDDGYIWLQHLPDNENYALTTMLNNKGKVVQWYFDIIKGSGIDMRGMPYFDDIYLDVVVFPSSEILLLDEDELDHALKVKDITQDEYDRAYKKAREIINGIAKKVDLLADFSGKYLKFMQSCS